MYNEIYMRAIWKVTCELLTKQAMRKNMYYIQKNIYILKLLLNIVTKEVGQSTPS
jgi:hypothetical protein